MQASGLHHTQLQRSKRLGKARAGEAPGPSEDVSVSPRHIILQICEAHAAPGIPC